MVTNSNFNFNAIGRVSSPYKEKFAIPRQPGLVSAAKGTITLINDANNVDLIKGIEQFSHLWLIFVFHATHEQGWKPLVRPPRLGGNKKMGVLATRSTFRPNPIGMSVVKLDGIHQVKEGGKLTKTIIDISALDLLDGTPILDIKPYIPYCDAVNHAEAGFAQTAPNNHYIVDFTKRAQQALLKYKNQYSNLTLLIEQVLAQDPRPAYKQNKPDDKIYGMKLYQFDIQWKMTSLIEITVIDIREA